MHSKDEDDISLSNVKTKKMQIDDQITEMPEQPKKGKGKGNVLKGTGDRDIKCYIPVAQKSHFTKTMKGKSDC